MLLPYLKLVGGAALLVIAAKLVVPDDPDKDEVQAAAHLWRAVMIIAVADIVMSLDNIIAIAAIAQGNLLLLIIGLAVSIPLIMAPPRSSRMNRLAIEPQRHRHHAHHAFPRRPHRRPAAIPPRSQLRHSSDQSPLTVVGAARASMPRYRRAERTTAFPGTRNDGLMDVSAARCAELEIGQPQRSSAPSRVTPYPRRCTMTAPGRASDFRIEAEGKAERDFPATPQWTDALLDVGRDADLFICEAYTRDKPIAHRTWRSVASWKRHLDQIRPKRLILTPYGRRHAGAAPRSAVRDGRRRHDRRVLAGAINRLTPPRSPQAPHPLSIRRDRRLAPYPAARRRPCRRAPRRLCAPDRRRCIAPDQIVA